MAVLIPYNCWKEVIEMEMMVLLLLLVLIQGIVNMLNE
jgi:hypothetical protein